MFILSQLGGSKDEDVSLVLIKSQQRERESKIKISNNISRIRNSTSMSIQVLFPPDLHEMR